MNSKRIRINLFLSLVDQFSVSGGNFLTVAICAHLLSPTEQGHFLFAYTSYIALLTLNIALFFAAAPVLMAQTEKPAHYAAFLAHQSLRFWSSSSLFVALFFFVFGQNFGWSADAPELLTLSAFLFCQQGADFARRLGYLNSENRQVARNSALLYSTRIVLLLLFRPDELQEILVLLTVCSLPWCLLSLNVLFCQKDISAGFSDDSARHWSLSKWALATTPLIWWFGYSPLFYLGAHATPSDVAILGNLRNLAGAANVLMELLETAVPVFLANKFVLHGKSHTKKMAFSILFSGILVWALGSVVILLFGDQILYLAFGSTYSSYADLLLLAWFGILCYFLTRVVQVYYRAQGIMHIDFIGGAVMAALTLIFLPSLARDGISSVLLGFAAFPLAAVVVQNIYVKFFRASLL